MLAVGATGCMVHAEGKLTAVLGAEDLIVVSTPDAVLVMPRSRAEDVKALVAELKRKGRVEAIGHRRVHRPWGYYESIDSGERFQVKRIVVAPGGKLSLQKHHHRAEHWVVVRGTAEVTVAVTFAWCTRTSRSTSPSARCTASPIRARIGLGLIEVQTGSYLGEDDIVRLEDIYRRT